MVWCSLWDIVEYEVVPYGLLWGCGIVCCGVVCCCGILCSVVLMVYFAIVGVVCYDVVQ